MADRNLGGRPFGSFTPGSIAERVVELMKEQPKTRWNRKDGGLVHEHGFTSMQVADRLGIDIKRVARIFVHYDGKLFKRVGWYRGPETRWRPTGVWVYGSGKSADWPRMPKGWIKKVTR